MQRTVDYPSGSRLQADPTAIEAEQFIAEVFAGTTQKTKYDIGSGRYPDVTVNSIANGKRAFHEVKTGYVSYDATARRQIANDAAIIDVDDSVSTITWHFFVSSQTGKVGPTKPLLNALERAGLPYQIHLTQ